MDKEAKRIWYKEYYQRTKAERNAVTNNWRKLHPEAKLIHSVRARAKERGWEFNLTKEDVVIPEICPYLGQPIVMHLGGGLQDFNPSIDRIDSSKGYIKGNIQVISALANRMKQNATPEQLLAFAEGILKLHGRTESNKTSIK